jgi:protein-disulfide isomerase
MQQIQALPSQQQFGELAKVAGFPEWAAMRGLPVEKSAACLANQSEVDRLVQMQNDAVSSYDIPGTPAFLLNGEMVKVEAGSTPWEQVEAKIKAALGG